MKKRMTYINSLDGLRALAIILVIGYHLRISIFRGGFIGVDMFFVLSGYLITNQILNKIKDVPKFSIKEFWFKRIKRLFPAMIMLLMVVTIYVLIKTPERWQSIISDDVAGVLGVSNWWYIIKKVPYTDTFSHPAPLKHLWSLAVEAQFYLLLPLLFVGTNPPKAKKKLAFVMLVAILIFSAISMGLWYKPGDINRAYYGTDTRIFGLLIGSLTAYLYPYKRLANQLPTKTSQLFDVIGTSLLVGLLSFVVFGNEFLSGLYHGGLLIISLVSAILMCLVIHPDTKLNRLFSTSLLRWIGTRSYSLYLWHYPIIVLMTPMKITGIYRVALMFFQVILMFVLAEMSYKYVETPFRKRTRGISWQQQLKQTVKRSATVRIEGLLIGITLIGMIFTTTFFNQMVAKSVDISYEKNKSSKKETIKEPQIKKIPINQVFMIGDSVLLGAKPDIEELIPQSQVDAKVGRQFIELPKILEKNYQHKFDTETVVLISLGTNGPFKEEELSNLYQTVTEKGAHLVLLNTYVPLNWQGQVNHLLADFTSTHQDVVLIDWHDYIADKLAYLEIDGVHPTVAGRELLATLIKEQLTKYFDFQVDTKEAITTESSH
ncbi:acyltransferase family protein [Vagococcus zengguangii]|uniref:Acyltransferase n=1 Tax=Vagococcus zengguangii TaxID=2571750 RepID=A0A4D7CW06_9ENTE|nr:acyltransferase family protein [Vagococcus zengguangii]QCI86457.1 acyltransferase [Vagococcus zengguangii]